MSAISAIHEINDISGDILAVRKANTNFRNFKYSFLYVCHMFGSPHFVMDEISQIQSKRVFLTILVHMPQVFVNETDDYTVVQSVRDTPRRNESAARPSEYSPFS